ncbi:hypothetical protein SESBI_09677 [Sesbania bispinosa]|nr:hypothetical protein SESBI_09677 [Sesbania bispinosa]
MVEIPVTNENPPTMEQRMERLEGSFSQILELLKTVIPEKEVINDNSNGNDDDGGGPSIKTNGTSQVGNSAPPQVNNVSFPNQLPTFQNPPYQSRKERLKIDPVPVPYSDLYDTLLQQHLVTPEVPQPVSNPPPKWYNPAKMCKYHMGAPGHSIEKCWTFKLQVQRLRDAGQLFFEEGERKSTGTSIDKDPLLKH